MITISIAVTIAIAMLGLSLFGVKNMHHPLYMHIAAFGLVTILAVYLGFTLLNGDLVSESTVIKNETVVGFTWNTSSNKSSANSTTYYSTVAVRVPIQNPVLSAVCFMFAAISAVLFVYSLFIALDSAFHPKGIDPYVVDDGIGEDGV